MKLLLHTCCAPCLIYPLENLEKKGFSVTGFFYNPNIHPFTEYKNRKLALEGLKTQVLYPEYSPQEFFQTVNKKEENPARCALCWEMRLRKTAKYAKEKGFPYFSTTLLVSPYQDQEILKKIGNDVAGQEAIEFYYEDFRPGYRAAHEKAKAQGIYCQKYCGCIYSEMERFIKK
ncbi:MAG: epoxyqueuosine reductase QueH [Candidatus Omnitrophica bacterium]|nr:epoxyqueuosine reductase QueH [Candidatus Omnitrophota bacterium]MDD5237094.1 epoxyqueuosine reductase QueH [Candidatus Omnitrophota bacterium]MDD5610895.1 epoxyqueuosine reductase QueH [Candidatus Omnitrophota bacterium]